jgi:hypothetical protein
LFMVARRHGRKSRLWIINTFSSVVTKLLW